MKRRKVRDRVTLEVFSGPSLIVVHHQKIFYKAFQTLGKKAIFATQLHLQNILMIPKTFETWKYCIEIQCGIKITESFIAARLQVYEDSNNPETKRFIALYGEQHLLNIIAWLKKSKNL